jgi:CAAX prenyl protease-like protein
MERFITPAALARCLPFVLFMVLLMLRGALPTDGSSPIDPRWVYGITVLVVGGSLAFFWRQYTELHKGTWLSLSELGLSVVVGVVVFALWINLDHPWLMMNVGEKVDFKPVDANGHLIWPLIAVRLIGAALLVPVMEELFWRSFLMRWVDKPEFESVDPKTVTLKAIVLSTFVFMLVHTLWFAAIVAGLAYAWLYRRTGKLWAPIVAHAVTNGVLGVWVVVMSEWDFW